MQYMYISNRQQPSVTLHLCLPQSPAYGGGVKGGGGRASPHRTIKNGRVLPQGRGASAHKAVKKGGARRGVLSQGREVSPRRTIKNVRRSP